MTPEPKGNPPSAREAGSSSKPAKRTEKKAPSDRQAKREAREAEAGKLLIAELDHLRVAGRQIASRYIELLESEIVQIREAVVDSRGARDRLSHLTAMLRSLEGLVVKPEKGRRKDLKRIDQVVALLNRVAEKL